MSRANSNGYDREMVIPEMRKKILVCNAGSSSLKFSLFEAEGELLLAEGSIDWTRKPTQLVFRRTGQQEIREELKLEKHADAAARILDDLQAGPSAPLDVLGELQAVGHRVVHGGERYTAAVRITPEVKRVIAELAELAPLHNPASLDGASFFIFSDYARPAIRLSALMELPTISIFTHDAMGDGEDGPLTSRWNTLHHCGRFPDWSRCGPEMRTRSSSLTATFSNCVTNPPCWSCRVSRSRPSTEASTHRHPESRAARTCLPTLAAETRK